jgi:ABC-type Fe3+-hydroxamate transport system substrate-binding protein
MNVKKKAPFKKSSLIPILFFIAIVAAYFVLPGQQQTSFTDGSGSTIEITKKPIRVVSLVPAITEIIFKVGADETLKGVTEHDTIPAGTPPKKIMGGFFSPDIDKIKEINPDMIFISSLHDEVREEFGDKAILIELDAHSVQDIYENISIIGRIFQKEEAARETIDNIKKEFHAAANKVKTISGLSKKRTIRLMGGDSVMVPGDDSFQNSYIRAAGGIPPTLNRTGNVVPITKEEWLDFNPQVIYACNEMSKAAGIIQNEPGWKDVDAVREGKIFYFPCNLTCRASINAGNFVTWLSSSIYEDEFLQKK